MRDGVAHLHFHGRFDSCDDIAHIPGTHLAGRVELEFQVADFLGLVLVAGGEEFHFVPLADGAVHYLKVRNDAAEGVEHGVEDQGLQRSVRVPFGCGHFVHDGVQHLLYAHAGAGTHAEHVLRLAAQKVAHLVLHQVRLGAVHVNLVEHGNNLQPMVDSLVQITNGLCLNTLRSIHHQQRALAGGNGTGHLITEVHVSWRVNQVEPIRLPTPHVIHLDGVALDGDALLPLQVHVVQHLVFHLAVAQRARKFQQTVCQGTFPMVDMGDNAKVADILHNLQR